MDACVEWQGKRDVHGYGRRDGKFRRQYGTSLLHRQLWIEEHGPIPDGLVVMHLCDNPPCVNLTHLRLGSQQENVADAKRKGRNYRPPKRTHCIHGHEFTEANTYRYVRDGTERRGCRTCARIRAMTYYVHHPRTITHCKHGHELTSENVYIDPRTGARCCRICRRRRHEDHERRSRAS